MYCKLTDNDSLTPQSSEYLKSAYYESPTKTLPPYINKSLYDQTQRSIKYLDSDDSFNDIFELLKTKSGRVVNENKRTNRATIHEAVHRYTNVRYIVKIVEKSKLPESAGGERIWKILCHRLLNITYQHNNVMTIVDIYESPERFYMICENLKGGELFEFLVEERAVPEELCKYIIKQIFKSLDFMHSNQLLHRDLKPENIIFRRLRPQIDDSDVSSADSYSVAKYRTMTSLECSQKMSLNELSKVFELAVIDFDTCKMTDIRTTDYNDVKDGRRRLVGTYGYLAPEVLKGHEYTVASDLWSVGIILYILITGVPPIPMNLMTNAKKSLEVLMQLSKKGINFDLAPFTSFTKAQHLCKKLLEFDPGKRIKCAKQALDHPWLVCTFNYTIPLQISFKDEYSNKVNYSSKPQLQYGNHPTPSHKQAYPAIQASCVKQHYLLNQYVNAYNHFKV